VNNRIVFLLGSLIVATALALLQTYNQYRYLSDLVVFYIGVIGGLLSLVQYFARKKGD
jgi:hypothetical protein